jgi:hypothetical protein
MGDHEARGDDFEKKAEKKLTGWGLFGSKYEDAADLFDKAANSFKLAKNCVRSSRSPVRVPCSFPFLYFPDLSRGVPGVPCLDLPVDRGLWSLPPGLIGVMEGMLGWDL